jgi:hypothetical protein
MPMTSSVNREMQHTVIQSTTTSHRKLLSPPLTSPSTPSPRPKLPNSLPKLPSISPKLPSSSLLPVPVSSTTPPIMPPQKVKSLHQLLISSPAKSQPQSTRRALFGRESGRSGEGPRRRRRGAGGRGRRFLVPWWWASLSLVIWKTWLVVGVCCVTFAEGMVLISWKVEGRLLACLLVLLGCLSWAQKEGKKKRMAKFASE